MILATHTMMIQVALRENGALYKGMSIAHV